MDRELIDLGLICSLLVVPRVLQRFKIPAPLTCLIFGVVAMLAFTDRVHDVALVLFGALGISSLFLFAGLDVDLGLLRQHARSLSAFFLVYCTVMCGVGWAACHFGQLPWQASGLLVLALFTPSTGFIVDSLKNFDLRDDERAAVANIAIAGEVFALIALFIIQQASHLDQMAIASMVLVGLLFGLPLLFVAFGRWVVPYAPGSEFSLLVMVGLIAAYATYKLGVYYLLGAFLVGLIARLLRQRMPLLASEANLHAVSLFASFFVPFYFFKVGTSIPSDAISFSSLGVGVTLTLVVIPVRLAVVWFSLRILFPLHSRSALTVAMLLTPTLVFTLVLAGILRERFHIDAAYYGGFVLYAALSTLFPFFLLRAAASQSNNHADATVSNGASHDGATPLPPSEPKAAELPSLPGDREHER